MLNYAGGCDTLWAFSWGKVRFALSNTNEIVAVGAPMSAVPTIRDTNTPVNAQIELLTTGDFIVRSNNVETVCRRVDPDDYDGDGWENGDDPDPYVGEEFSS